MNLDLVQVCFNLLGLFLLIAVGFGMVRLGVVSRDISGPFSRFLLKVTLPCTIFTSLLRPYEPSFFRKVVIILALGMILFPVNALISWLLARLFRVPQNHRGVWAFCATFCNTGFMGFPIVLALFGEEGLSMAVVLNITFNVLVYSMGARMICADRAGEGEGVHIQWHTVLFTTINFATVLGLIFYFTHLSIPAAVLTPLTHLSNITTPLSMIVTGINLSNGNWTSLFSKKDAITSSLARLVICPAANLLILHAAGALLHLRGSAILSVVFVVLAMPTPAVATILAENYQADQEFAALTVFLSSLLCILTIPLMTMLLPI